MSNIVGNPFRSFVTEQINTRQEVLSNTFRDDNFLKYVSKTPWLRMASSIDINSSTKADELGLPLGVEGAKQFVLQGGSLSVSREAANDDISYTSLGQKFGVATDNSIINQNSYGFGGSDWGKTPMPGLTSVTVEDANRGAIRKATVNFTCTNIQQFEIISTLYMRVGYNVLVEWGHSVYLNNSGLIEPRLDFNTPAFTSFFEGKNEQTIYQNIQTEQKNTDGNYDAFMGVVTNFNWKFTNGAYECSISVLTRGDVIESLKVNQALDETPTTDVPPPNTRFVQTGLDPNDGFSVFDPTSELNSGTTTSTTGSVDFTGPLKEDGTTGDTLIDSFIRTRNQNRVSNILYNNYKKLIANQTDNDNTIKTEDGFTEFLKFSNGNQDNWFYVSLGALLRIIESNNLLYDKDVTSPIINIDSNYTTNFCARFPEQVSTDWSKCYVPYKVFNGERTEFVDNPEIDKLLGSKEKRYDKNNYSGQLMCILLNVSFINNLLGEATDKNGRLSIKDFLTDILSEAQRSLGAINDFKIGYDYVTNTLKIYDNSPLVCSQLVNKSKPQFTKFQSYGLQKNQSASFLLDLNIESSLTPEIANMIAAGAQTNGNQIGENATAFSLWNEGLVNRVRPKNLDAQTSKEQSEEEKTASEELRQKFINNKTKIYKLLLDITSPKPSSDVDLKSAENINIDFAKYYLGLVTRKEKDLGLPGNFFIPFNLGLKMDGLSGMRLFDGFSITNEVLPAQYTDALTFIINGINHSISEAGWTTSISSQTFNQFEATNPKPIEFDADSLRGETDLLTENFTGPTPFADFLRSKYEELSLTEKQSGDNNLGNQNAEGPQLSNGGDITKEMAFATIALFREMRKQLGVNYVNANFQITAGNDLYHQNDPGSTSFHKVGLALDFTANTKSGRNNKYLRSLVFNVIKQFIRGNDNFNAIDEYAKLSENGTGGHFHLVSAVVRANSTAGITRQTAKELEGTAGNTRNREIPTLELQKEYNEFARGVRSKIETEKANSFIPKSRQGKI